MSDEYDRIVSMGWGSATSGDVGGDMSALQTERDAWNTRTDPARRVIAAEKLAKALKQAQKIIDPCYPQRSLDWQNDATAALAEWESALKGSDNDRL